MAFGGIKTYQIVRLNFINNTYQIFTYEKDRRLTARQAWHLIYHSTPNFEANISNHATIDDYYDILAKHEFDEKYCDRYCSFKGF